MKQGNRVKHIPFRRGADGQPFQAAPLIFFVSVLLVSGCAGSGPAVIGIPDYVPDNGRDVTAVLPEPEIELPELPEPADAERPVRKEVIRYRIDPEEGYASEEGYLRVTFSPAEDGGTISVHIGHKKVEGANTKWYSYTLTFDGRNYAKQGQVSVPFVRGRDNYWWNEEALRLPKPLEKEAVVTVVDAYEERVRKFTITKEVIEK